MKKTLFTLTSLVLIGALTVTGVYLQDRESLSDVALANAEAIASGESGEYNNGPGRVFDCGLILPDGNSCAVKILVCQFFGEGGCTEVVCTAKH